MKSLKVIVIELSSARGLENAQKIVIDGGGGQLIGTQECDVGWMDKDSIFMWSHNFITLKLCSSKKRKVTANNYAILVATV